MSFWVAPDAVRAAAQNLGNIHATLAESSASVAPPTTGVAAAAEDQVSAAVAAYFSSFGEEYQVLSAQAQSFHAEFVDLLTAGAAAYAGTEIANAEQAAASLVTAPAQGLLGAAAGAGSAAASAMGVAQPAAVPILGGLGAFGGLGGPGGVTAGSPLGGIGGGTPVGPLLGGLGGGSVVSSLNGIVTALESGGAVSPLSGPIGTGLHTLYRDIAALPGMPQQPGSGVAPGWLHAGASTGGTTGPYQTLLDNTVANLRTLGGSLSASPEPFLNQILTNWTGYANTIGADLYYAIHNFPAVLAAAPANIQAAWQGLLAFDPAPYAEQFIGDQITYAAIIATSLQQAGQSFLTGLQGLPAAFQSAYQALGSGNIGGAAGDVTGGLLNLFVTGLDTTSRGSLPGTLFADVTLTGSVAELTPIATVPGMMAQNFTSLLPAGSIAAQISQHATNVIDTLTDTSLTGVVKLTLPSLRPPSSGSFTLAVTAGLPTALILDALGAPVNALDAASAGAAQFAGQLQTGNLVGAIGTAVDGPAVVGDAFLNGRSTLPITFDAGGYPATVNFPLDGLLDPVTPYTATISGLLLGRSITSTVGGTPLSGLATGLLVYAPAQLARAIAP